MNKLTTLALASVSLSVLATAVTAQPAATSSDDSTLSEVVVTARRREESLQTVPQTVNAVSGNTLQKLNIQRFEDIQAVVPGLTLSSGSSGYSTAATVRGASFQQETGAQPTVAFYLNDATINSAYLFESLFDVGQIEVLRGPQGTLRGEASPSGSITVTTRRPTLGEGGGYADVTATDHGGRNLNGAVNVPIIADKLGVRLAAIIDDNRYDQVRSINNPLRPYSKSWGVRPSIRWEPTDAVAVNVMYQHMERKLGAYDPVESLSQIDPSAPVVNPVIHASDSVGIAGAERTTRQVQDALIGNLDVRFSGQKLSYVGSLSEQTITAFTPGDAGNAFPGVVYGQDLVSKGSQVTHELRLASEDRLFGQFDYTVGAFVSRFGAPSDLTNQSAITAFGNLVFIADTPIFNRGVNKERSIFGNATWHVGDATELSGGLRHIWYEDHGELIVSSNSLFQERSKDQKTIYNLSLSHKFTPDFLAYANTGTAFRPGPFLIGVFRPLTPTLRQFVDLQNETSKSYEVGFKSTFLDKRALFNVAIYHQDFNNFIYRGSAVSYVDLNQNGLVPSSFNFGSSVDAKIDGVDVEAAFQVMQGFNVSAAFSYAKSKIKNDPVACNDLDLNGVPDSTAVTPTLAQLLASTGSGAVAQCIVHDPISFSPKWSLTLQSEYARPISSSVDGYVRGLLSYYPKNRQDPYNPYDNVDNYGLLNLYLGVRSRDGAWELALFGKNITNTDKVLSRSNGVITTGVQELQPPTFTSAIGRSIPSSYVSARSTPPREFGVNLRYAFGSR
ncbi:TonB-dependent receptor [Phenylobacterium sp. LjRoot225]|uniref:TonB-dependent receptor n=1 Tax=Phenylobacterium sp. LjRoot225 TaxID=3342285 RepID=UPI003ED1019D